MILKTRRSTLSLVVGLFLVLLLGLQGCGGDLARAPTDGGRPEPAPGIPGDGGQGGSPQPGQLTAGEWRDLAHWPFWLELMDNQDWAKLQAYWSFYPTERLPVEVTSGGQKVLDANVVLSDDQGSVRWQTKTDAQGHADLFVRMFDEAAGPFDLTVTTADASATVRDVAPGGAEPVAVELDTLVVSPDALDLMFVVDTTGSMGDELDYLKAELQNVVERVERASAQTLDLRLSVNFYRDEGDEYVLRSFPFSSDIAVGLQQLARQRSSGGGDMPEAAEVALKDAVDNHQWSAQARARLLFLVLDAPPHHEQGILKTVQEVTQSAARQGIRVIPVASSGVDKETEFFLRFLSVATGGTYVFLTDDSGIGNDHLEPTVGKYEVELLNDLLVRVINEFVTLQD